MDYGSDGTAKRCLFCPARRQTQEGLDAHVALDHRGALPPPPRLLPPWRRA